MSQFSASAGINGQRGTEFNATAAGTNSGATATKAAATGTKHYITDVDFWTDTDSLLQILDGSTVIKEWKIDVSAQGWNFSRSFRTPLIGTEGGAVSAKITSSASDCHVSFGGFSDIP